jgi:hypothetical protein
MKLCLKISEREGGKGYSLGKRFSFAVIDLDKADAYPLNFVCMLPTHLNSEGKTESTFGRTFGDKSYLIAQELLRDALRIEQDAEVKGEIKRRLKLLEPRPEGPEVEKRCLSCGKIYKAKPKHGFKQKYCPQCLKKKFGNRKQQ